MCDNYIMALPLDLYVQYNSIQCSWSCVDTISLAGSHSLVGPNTAIAYCKDELFLQSCAHVNCK